MKKLIEFFKKICACKEVLPEKTQVTEGESPFSIEDFARADLRIGRVIKAEKLEGSEKLIKCEVDFGPLGTRTVLSSIARFKDPQSMEGELYVYLTNLPPRKIMGVESQAMILAAQDKAGRFAALVPEGEVEEGAKVS